MRTVIIILIAILLVGCGGGGGGGSGSGGSASTGVRVLHSNIEAAPVVIESSTGPVDEAGQPESLQIAKFASPTLYSELDQGAQDLLLHERFNSNAYRSSFPVTVAKNQRYSVLFYGDLNDFGPRASIFNDAPPTEIGAGEVALRVVHGMVGASNVDVSTDAGSIATGVGFGGASEYKILPIGTQVLVTRVTDKRIVHRGGLALAGGNAYTILVGGEVDYLVTTTTFED